MDSKDYYDLGYIFDQYRPGCCNSDDIKIMSENPVETYNRILKEFREELGFEYSPDLQVSQPLELKIAYHRNVIIHMNYIIMSLPYLDQNDYLVGMWDVIKRHKIPKFKSSDYSSRDQRPDKVEDIKNQFHTLDRLFALIKTDLRQYTRKWRFYRLLFNDRPIVLDTFEDYDNSFDIPIYS